MFSDGKYYFAQEGTKVFFKLVGTLKYTAGSKFDTFLDNLFESDNNFDEVLIDLSEADFLDSTNLGFLARVAEYMDEEYGKKVTIYSPKEEINKLLESVGFDEVFILEKNIEKPERNLKEISEEGQTDRSRSAMMLEAHKALIKVCEKNADVFCDVVDLLKKSVKKEEENKT